MCSTYSRTSFACGLIARICRSSFELLLSVVLLAVEVASARSVPMSSGAMASAR